MVTSFTVYLKIATLYPLAMHLLYTTITFPCSEGRLHIELK